MSTFYVNKSGNDGNSGASHAAAKLTIGGAITAAISGDTINVGTGNYNETVNPAGKNLTFNADGYVVLDGQSTLANGITIFTAAFCTFNDFVIRGYTTAGLNLSFNFGTGTTTFNRCIFHNCMYGAYAYFNDTTLSTVFRYCLAYDCTYGFNAAHAAGIVNWFNCTAVDCTTGFLKNGAGTFTGYNNIASNCTTLFHASNTTNITNDYNLLYFDGTANAKWGSTPYTTLATWQSASGKDANSTSADPLFNDRAKDSYTLQAASTGFTGGYVLGGYPEQKGAFTRLVTAISSNINPTLISGGVFVNTSQDGSGNIQLDSGSSGTFAIDVLNYAVSRNIRKAHTKSSETYPASVIDDSIADSAPNRKKYEYRYSDTAFLKGDASPSWNTIEIDQDITVSARYWQFRFTLRTNGVAT